MWKIFFKFKIFRCIIFLMVYAVKFYIITFLFQCHKDIIFLFSSKLLQYCFPYVEVFHLSKEPISSRLLMCNAVSNVYIGVLKFLDFFVFGILKFHCNRSSYGLIIFIQERGQNRLSEKQSLILLLGPC